ncbi:MoxR-like ATPase [Desulfotomaculum arcticum]|uniref:MoxR-like ATPase n=1 Tax=Desulfotruncus arcticus DSM 17038 TaxID=1121424 RepID=A0A1I2MZZ7_9FIRM|nr:MoxR family ATPase [Desulfotruncus arcticus]SFF97185.1 MoxR-like ATPase [Desulfotomaculum arcticum] [Desulfotruncus arcticus DSM 17038]
MDLTIKELKVSLENEGYICDDDLVITVFLALKLGKPLLIEGAPGVGKTEIAKVLAAIFETDLIRLQCYEGLDENKALYEWNYQRQLIKIQLSKETESGEKMERNLFSEDYLLERPLLHAIRSEKQVVLLIDEVDKVEAEFEAFLFEVLSDFQVSIPELGTVAARHIPIVVLTSNGERELSDGLKRRCVYLYIDFPSIEKESRILQVKVPKAGLEITKQIANIANYIRNNLNLRKKPSIAETIDWARALSALNETAVTPENINSTLNIFLKNRDDQQIFISAINTKDLAGKAAGDKSIKSANLHAGSCHCHGHHHHK